ncbi:MAG: riboflavin synthase [Candidatus Sumerlaeota bacterium]
MPQQSLRVQPFPQSEIFTPFWGIFMFTGLIQEVGQIQSIQTSGDAARLRIGCTMAPDLAIGESVAVNGACLTVEQKGADNFLAYASAETLTKTALDGLGSGKPVNLERALQLGDRLGGHLVAGHVDATGRFDSLREADEGYWLKIHAPDEILKLSVPKGSITVDGISLTIVDLTSEYFTVAVIRHDR